MRRAKQHAGWLLCMRRASCARKGSAAREPLCMQRSRRMRDGGTHLGGGEDGVERYHGEALRSGKHRVGCGALEAKVAAHRDTAAQ